MTTPDVFRSQTPSRRRRTRRVDRRPAMVDGVRRRGASAADRTALAENFDLQIAASRILQAEAQLGITRADQLPTVNGQASVQGSHGRSSTGRAADGGHRCSSADRCRGRSISGASSAARPRPPARRSRRASGAAGRSSPAWSARSRRPTSSCGRSIRSSTSPVARSRHERNRCG